VQRLLLISVQTCTSACRLHTSGNGYCDARKLHVRLQCKRWVYYCISNNYLGMWTCKMKCVNVIQLTQSQH